MSRLGRRRSSHPLRNKRHDKIGGPALRVYRREMGLGICRFFCVINRCMVCARLGVLPGLAFGFLGVGMDKGLKVHFVSLGCDKNLVDTEKVLGLLAPLGYGFTDDVEQADIAIVNTCCFIHDAKEESIEALLELAGPRREGRLQALLVMGCLAQRYQEEIQREIPEVDAILGSTALEEVAPAIERVLAGRAENCYPDIHAPQPLLPRRVLTTGGHYAYLKIAEGCDKHCTYCIIPSLRGRFRSLPLEALEEEASLLAAQGVKELILVAQETTRYGLDLYGKKSLPLLLERLNALEGIRWIRLLYAYPEEIDRDLIEAMAGLPKVLHYIDMPIQHASDSILAQMGRRTSQADIEAVVEALRQAMPDICIRTTLISGFPGESQEDYEELYRFVNRMEFDRLGVFAYSQEENTPAGRREDQIPPGIREERRAELMELQQAIAFEKGEAMAGRRLEVSIEGYLAEEEVYVGRSYMDAPGIDGWVFVYSNRPLESGEFVEVEIMASREYDLEGRLVEEAYEPAE